MLRTAGAAVAGCLLCASAHLAVAQTDPVVDPTNISVINPTKETLNALHSSPSLSIDSTVSAPAPALPLWQYSVVSPRDGNTYSGAIVGGNPFNRGARTTNLNIVLIPLRVQFTGTVRAFDPTSPDAGCLGASVTALSLSQQSPIFNTVPNFTMNGVNVGTVTFPDAYLRASFWSTVSAVSPAYHIALDVTTEPVQTVTLANNLSGSGGTATFSGHTYCSTNSLTSDNPPLSALIDVNYMDPQLTTIISNLNLNANQFAFFVMYDVLLTEGPPQPNLECCILGYHSTVNKNPTFAVPGQTYGIAGYDASGLFSGTSDISVMSHEFMEWVNDPSDINFVPLWGNIGQVSGCQNNLEVGDPLSGTLAPAITMPNGNTYHPQELAFYSWFIGGTSTGAGGKYSTNGKFTTVAANCN